MSAVMQLEELMQYKADVTLLFDDGSIKTNSIVVGMHSSVLRGALEAASAPAGAAPPGRNASSSNSSCNFANIPLEGITKDEWMQVAPYLYPVLPRPVIRSWTQLDVLLKVATRLDIQIVLHAADSFLLSKSKQLVSDPESEQCVWKWLRQADKAGLQECLSLLADRAAEVDNAACKVQRNLKGLSSEALQLLVVACASHQVGSTCELRCWKCHPHVITFGPEATPCVNTCHTLRWVCNKCQGVSSS